MEAEVLPVIRGTSGTISKSLRQYLSNIPGKQEIKEIKKIVILGTAHILREVLTLKLPTTTIVAQPFNVIKCQLKFNPVA